MGTQPVDDGIKQRLIGAVVLVALMVIFVPMFFVDEDVEPVDILIEMPEKPSVPEFDISKPVKPSEQQVIDEPDNDPIEEPIDKIVEKAVEKAVEAPVDEPVKTKSQPQLVKPNLEELKDKKVDAQGLPVSWVLQVASFREQGNAEKLRDKLRKGGYKAYIKFRLDVKPKMVRVFVGPVLERKVIDEIKVSISKKFQLNGVVVRYLP